MIAQMLTLMYHVLTQPAYMVHECAKDSIGLRKAGMTSMSRRLAVADEVYIVLEFYKRYNIPREL